MKRDIGIELMRAKANEVNKQLEFNLKMYELKRMLNRIDSKLGGGK
ncbi:hypothetical protein M4D68_09690 [Priestia aryabhattai]|nr:hypothetical protein [Priestia aryabhattai]MCM3641408.1 hypothetical protein [Priestia aryabhattai]